MVSNHLSSSSYCLDISIHMGAETTLGFLHVMDLIHYLFTPLNLFLVPYTLDILPYYLSFANGIGGVGIF